MRITRELRQLATLNFTGKCEALQAKLAGVNEKYKKLGINEKFNFTDAGHGYVTIHRKGMMDNNTLKPVDEALDYAQGLRDAIDYVFANVKTYAITNDAVERKTRR